MNIPWNVMIFCPAWGAVESTISRHATWSGRKRRGGIWRVYAWLGLRAEYHFRLYSLRHSYDAYVLRYYVHDPFQLLFILFCSRPVYLVHHTLEFPELAGSGFLGRLRAALDSLIGKYAIKKSAGIIAVTQEILDYERKRAQVGSRKDFLYPNGIFFDHPPVIDRRNETVELLFVAGHFASWHGLDLLLNEVAVSADQFVLHLVGELSEEDHARAFLDERIVIHGRLSIEAIRAVAESCSLGLSSFALHRNGMEEACTLKVREYLVMGLPVYAAHREVFPASFDFYRNGAISLPDILSFARSTSLASREQVAAAAKPYIDKATILDSLYRGLVHAQDDQR
ncbi:glycosyltransferase [Pseudomonas sp. o96-267]|uniref:glycosyltransferase n=1 Tax=Pseudomonas sp. o96-267 TaxID=2479853 RepID=UPI001319C7FC|nr:glycosyltransferase [Pseudomonas sp. o96-267]